MKQPLFLKPYGLAWRLARPLLRRHKRLSVRFSERLVPDGWPEDSLAPKDRLDTVAPPFRLWLHAASGGEAYLARAIVAELASRVRDLNIVCTSMTEQGVEVLKQLRQDFSCAECFIAVNYFPLDQPGLMKKALEQVFGPPVQAPRAVALLETEIWPGLLAACREYGVRSYIFNGRMTEGSLKAYRHISGTLRSLAPEKIMANSQADAARFREIFDAPGAPSRVSLMPNIKFDRVAPAKNDGKNDLRPLLGATPSPVILLASVREEEEAALMGLLSPLRRAAPKAAIIVAPRHMHRAQHWVDTLSGMLAGTQHFKMRSKGLKSVEAGDVVLWDAFGELMALYGLSTAVFVGGSLAPLGGQNFLEPLSFGVTPIIGPSWENFHWVGTEPFKLGLVKQVQDPDSLQAALLAQLHHPSDKSAVKAAFAAYLKTHQGGARQVADFLIKELWED